MALETCLGVLGVAFAFVGGFLAMYAADAWYLRMASRMRSTGLANDPRAVHKAAGSSPSFIRVVMATGVPLFYPVARAVLKHDRARRTVANVMRMAQLNSAGRADVAFLSAALAGELLLAGLAAAVSQSLVFGVIVAGFAGVVVAVRAGSIEKRLCDEIRRNIPDALSAMGRCFQSGFSMQQVFEQLAEGPYGELAKVFAQCSNKLQAGAAVGSALESLRMHRDIPELVFLSAALEIQHRTGGSMKPVLDAATATIRDKVRLERSLRAQTAQAMLSARVVGAMPFVLLAILTLMSSDFMAPYFQSAAGIGIFTCAVGLQVAGIFAVKSMVKVKG